MVDSLFIPFAKLNSDFSVTLKKQPIIKTSSIYSALMPIFQISFYKIEKKEDKAVFSKIFDSGDIYHKNIETFEYNAIGIGEATVVLNDIEQLTIENMFRNYYQALKEGKALCFIRWGYKVIGEKLGNQYNKNTVFLGTPFMSMFLKSLDFNYDFIGKQFSLNLVRSPLEFIDSITVTGQYIMNKEEIKNEEEFATKNLLDALDIKLPGYKGTKVTIDEIVKFVNELVNKIIDKAFLGSIYNFNLVISETEKSRLEKIIDVNEFPKLFESKKLKPTDTIKDLLNLIRECLPITADEPKGKERSLQFLIGEVTLNDKQGLEQTIKLFYTDDTNENLYTNLTHDGGLFINYPNTEVPFTQFSFNFSNASTIFFAEEQFAYIKDGKLAISKAIFPARSEAGTIDTSNPSQQSSKETVSAKQLHGTSSDNVHLSEPTYRYQLPNLKLSFGIPGDPYLYSNILFVTLPVLAVIKNADLRDFTKELPLQITSSPFSGLYRIENLTHKIDNSSGYTTDISLVKISFTQLPELNLKSG